MFKHFFNIPGKPLPKCSHRDAEIIFKKDKFGNPTKRFTRKYFPRRREADGVSLLIKSQYGKEPYEKPLIAEYVFVFPFPKQWSKAQRERVQNLGVCMVARPDLTNLVKFYEDCMNKIVFLDDKQVINHSAVKIYGDVAHTLICVREPEYAEIQEFLDKQQQIDYEHLCSLAQLPS